MEANVVILVVQQGFEIPDGDASDRIPVGEKPFQRVVGVEWVGEIDP